MGQTDPIINSTGKRGQQSASNRSGSDANVYYEDKRTEGIMTGKGVAQILEAVVNRA